MSEHCLTFADGCAWSLSAEDAAAAAFAAQMSTIMQMQIVQHSPGSDSQAAQRLVLANTDQPKALEAAIPAAVQAVRCGQPALYVYDSRKCVEVLMRNNKWSEEKALDWFSFNVEGAWMGKHTPLFADFYKEED